MFIMRALSLVLLIVAIGCSDPMFSDRDPLIVGLIVAGDIPSDMSQGGRAPKFPFDRDGLQVWVKESAEAECGIVFEVDPETPIARRTSDGSLRDAEVNDLVPDTRIAAWAPSGDLPSSCPGQALAEAIEILK